MNKVPLDQETIQKRIQIASELDGAEEEESVEADSSPDAYSINVAHPSGAPGAPGSPLDSREEAGGGG